MTSIGILAPRHPARHRDRGNEPGTKLRARVAHLHLAFPPAWAGLCHRHGPWRRFATLALVKLVALLQQVEWLYLVLKFAGGLYALYLGIRIWQGARAPLTQAVNGEDGKSVSLWRSLGLAFVTQVSNPKTAVVYASIFAALMPTAPPFVVLLILPPAIFVVEATWYAVVAYAFSAPRSQRVYLRFTRLVGKLSLHVTAGIFGLIV
ncbi:MAG: LysE family transporter [Ideonella sp.]|nr:LysE family transporter [Ideonella sp.]